jgi:endonuclease YncB( thermonuclease family)|tara:strand:- start:2969 stop:3397 length:429 start_codon:yes stop_codon:yes gene_type:complete
MVHDFVKFPELTNSQMDLYYFESPHRQIVEDFECEVVKVHDGDTITVRWRERDFDFPVRFLHIDAPELKDPGGKASQSWLEQQILNKTVTVKVNKNNRVGKWGRILGEVQHGGMVLNEMSLMRGFSKPFGQSHEGAIPEFKI